MPPREPIQRRGTTARLRCLVAALGWALLCATAAAAPAPTPASLAGAAARRFPQPVRVGTLLHRSVLQPVESQKVLGHVRAVVRSADGTVELVVDEGGLLFGLDARPVAVPADALALQGPDLDLPGLTPAQLRALPTFDAASAAPLPDNATIMMGLAGPSH